MIQTSNITSRLEKLTRFIETAQEKLDKGEVINLSHLDGEVAQLCDQALALPPAEAVKVQPAMATMINKLETLGLALQSFQNKMKSKQGDN